MTSYTNPFTGQTISPSSVSYEALTIGVNTTLDWPINGNTSSTLAAAIIDVTATAAGLVLSLPPATQVSTGQTILVRNIGANAFEVSNNSGGAVASVASGVAQFVWLTDNTTTAGVWASVTLGAGTAAANAADLAGAGLEASNTQLNAALPVSALYSAYTLLSTDRAKFFTWNSGAGTITLPSASAVGNSWFVAIRNSGTGILTLQPHGADLIDGAASAQLQISESLVLVSSGTGFSTYGYGRSNLFIYTQLAKVVTSGTYTLTAVEAANTIQEYTGTLTGNVTVVLPPTVQLYAVANRTTGSFNLTFTTGAVGGATLTLSQGQTAMLVCDGTNIFNAASVAAASVSNITLPNGAVTSPSLNFLGDSTTGLYLPASAQLGFAVGGSNSMTLTLAGLQVPVGIAGGTF